MRMTRDDIVLIGIDWGSTRVRAHAIGRGGALLASVQRDRGMTTLATPDDFANELRSLLNAEVDDGRAPILIAGMAGARGGWREMPYVELPADPARVADALEALSFADRKVMLVPGACSPGADFDDVMRGEETQAFGLPHSVQRAIAPGTHSKWMRLDRGRILEFSTYPTGELYAVLMQHAIIGRGLPTDAWSSVAFDDGVATSRRDPDWLHQVFGVRARHVRGQRPQDELPAFLSGLLIGYECAAAFANESPDAITLVGTTQLAMLYAQALQQFGCNTVVVDGDAAFCTGLWRIADAAGLL